jgi:taurine dioxygenase
LNCLAASSNKFEQILSSAEGKYICRFKWEKDSIAFWDNRSVLHKPDNNYWPQLRRMERITIDDPDSPY